VLYRPSEKKLKNASQKDYMGKAKLVAASDPGDAFTEFTGVTRLKQGISPAGVYVDKPLADGASPNLSRSATTPSLPSKTSGDLPASGLGRAQTTLNSSSKPADTLGRSNTQITPAKPSAAAMAGMGGPVRGLSVRRPGDTPQQQQPPPPPPAKAGERFTEFYDDYLNSYDDDAPPPVPSNGPPDRVAAWARSNANPNNPPGRGPARSNSSYAPSSYGGGSVRRKVTRRITRGPSSRTQSAFYEEDEEGYVSGDYDDTIFELTKIRVKLHYQDDVRGMALVPETMFEEFMDKVTAKFGKEINGLSLKFKDEDGGKVSLRDDSDYELAIETARESAKGKPEGKLEIWCSDI